MRITRLALLLACAATCGGCLPLPGDVVRDAVVPGATLHCPPRTRPMVQERLYFGTGRPRGDSAVSEDEWNAFVADVVAPAFPDGFTSWNAAGGWRGPDGRPVRESSRVLEVLHLVGTAAEAAVQKVAASYNARFDQDAVMRTVAPACVEFVQAR